jgi:hypothetical protein
VRLGDALANRQSESGTSFRAGASRVHAVEPFAHVREVLGGDPLPGVPHLDHHGVSARPGAQRDLSSPWGVPERVPDEVDEQPDQGVVVAQHGEWFFREPDVDGRPRLHRDRSERIRKEGGQFQWSSRQTELLGIGPRQQQEILDE